MKLFLIEYMNRMGMSEFSFFNEAYEWKFRHCGVVDNDVDNYVQTGAIPEYVMDYIRYIQSSFQ